jgi:hypothetical protein
MFTKSQAGAALAVGTMLTELLEVLVTRNVLSNDDVADLLNQSIRTLSKQSSRVSHIDAITITTNLLNRFQKSSA